MNANHIATKSIRAHDLARRVVSPSTAKPGSPLARRAEVLDALRGYGEPMSFAELTELLEFAEWDLRTHLSHLIAEGLVLALGVKRVRRYVAAQS